MGNCKYVLFEGLLQNKTITIEDFKTQLYETTHYTWCVAEIKDSEIRGAYYSSSMIGKDGIDYIKKTTIDYIIVFHDIDMTEDELHFYNKDTFGFRIYELGYYALNEYSDSGIKIVKDKISDDRKIIITVIVNDVIVHKETCVGFYRDNELMKYKPVNIYVSDDYNGEYSKLFWTCKKCNADNVASPLILNKKKFNCSHCENSITIETNYLDTTDYFFK